MTIVGIILSCITNFTTLWTQTPSDYNWLIANELHSNFVHPHGPVLSHQRGKHFIYSKYNFLRPGGVLVWCHNRACKEPLTRRAHSKHVYYKCGECHSTCTTLLVKMDQTTLLGHITVVKTSYPQPQYPVEWS